MPHGRRAKNSCQRVCMPGVRTWFFIARCGNGDSSTRTKTWRKPRCPNCKRCKNDGADSWACLNLFEAEIAFRLGEIHIYLKKHQIQTSEFQSFCDRWIVFSPWRNDDFLKKTVFHDLTFRSAGMFLSPWGFPGRSWQERHLPMELAQPLGQAGPKDQSCPVKIILC